MANEEDVIKEGDIVLLRGKLYRVDVVVDGLVTLWNRDETIFGVCPNKLTYVGKDTLTYRLWRSPAGKYPLYEPPKPVEVEDKKVDVIRTEDLIKTEIRKLKETTKHDREEEPPIVLPKRTGKW